MYVETIEDSAGRRWELHRISPRWRGDDEQRWVASSADESGDVFVDDSRAELLRLVERSARGEPEGGAR